MVEPLPVRRRLNRDEEADSRGGGGGGGGGGGRGGAVDVDSPLQGLATAGSSAVPPTATMPTTAPPSGTGSDAAGVGSRNGGGVETSLAVLLSRRTPSFSSETWWMVDVEANPPQGATRLVKMCMRAYGWDSGKARSVLRAYRQLLFLKTTYGDYDAQMFSPSSTVDMMWHRHILDVVNYVHDCALLCGGRVVGHNPLGSAQGPERDARRRATRQALLRHKSEIGIEHVEWKELFDDSTNEADSAPSHKKESFQLYVVASSGSRFTIESSPDGRLSDVYDGVASKTGIPSRMFRLLSAGRLVGCSSTSLRAFGLMDKSTILQVTFDRATSQSSLREYLKKAIQLDVKTSTGKVFTIVVWPDSGRLSDLYDAVHAKEGNPPNQFRLIFAGQQLENDEHTSPRAMGLKNKSTIHMVLLLRGC